MIEKHYAAHIKNTLDAAAINVMRPKAARAAEKAAKPANNGSGAGKPKAATQLPHADKTERKQAVRDVGLRVTDANLVPGTLTSES